MGGYHGYQANGIKLHVLLLAIVYMGTYQNCTIWLKGGYNGCHITEIKLHVLLLGILAIVTRHVLHGLST